MTPLADCLYPLEAAWQSPRPMTDPVGSEAVDASDPPSVRAAGAKLLSDRAEQIIKLVGLLLMTTAAVTAPYLVFNGRVSALETAIGALTQTVAGNDKRLTETLSANDKHLTEIIASNDKRLDEKLNVIGTWLRDPTKFPGGGVIPSPSANSPDPVSQGLRGFPSNVAPVSAPECVSSKTFNKMPCELAAKDGCRGLSGFTPERYREIRLKAGVGEYMLVCAEKAP